MKKSVIIAIWDGGVIECYNTLSKFLKDNPQFSRDKIDWRWRIRGEDYEGHGCRLKRLPIIR